MLSSFMQIAALVLLVLALVVGVTGAEIAAPWLLVAVAFVLVMIDIADTMARRL